MRMYYNGGGSAAWQRKEGKSPSGGLNKKGRASYKAQTGGTLKAPTKSKTSGRRKSFCARMGGMKKRKKIEFNLMKVATSEALLKVNMVEKNYQINLTRNITKE